MNLEEQLKMATGDASIDNCKLENERKEELNAISKENSDAFNNEKEEQNLFDKRPEVDLETDLENIPTYTSKYDNIRTDCNIISDLFEAAYNEYELKLELGKTYQGVIADVTCKRDKYIVIEFIYNVGRYTTKDLYMFGGDHDEYHLKRLTKFLKNNDIYMNEIAHKNYYEIADSLKTILVGAHAQLITFTDNKGNIKFESILDGYMDHDNHIWKNNVDGGR